MTTLSLCPLPCLQTARNRHFAQRSRNRVKGGPNSGPSSGPRVVQRWSKVVILGFLLGFLWASSREAPTRRCLDHQAARRRLAANCLSVPGPGYPALCTPPCTTLPVLPCPVYPAVYTLVVCTVVYTGQGTPRARSGPLPAPGPGPPGPLIYFPLRYTSGSLGSKRAVGDTIVRARVVVH